jgi:hypothetical protein
MNGYCIRKIVMNIKIHMELYVKAKFYIFITSYIYTIKFFFYFSKNIKISRKARILLNHK